MAKIVVIDDEPLIGELLRYQLSGVGHEVRYFQHGLEALRHMPLERPDLIMLDVMMPELSGWELCEQIRVGSEVPIIMLTAKHADDDIVRGLNSGADDYIGKPFTLAQLQARIEAVLRRTKRRSGGATSAPQVPEMSAPIVEERPREPVSSTERPVASIKPRLGPTLAAERQRRGLSLYQTERLCDVRWEHLQAIEREDFSFMPRPLLREAIRKYSNYLEIDLRVFMGPAPKRFSFFGVFPIALSAMVLLVFVIVVGLYIW